MRRLAAAVLGLVSVVFLLPLAVGQTPEGAALWEGPVSPPSKQEDGTSGALSSPAVPEAEGTEQLSSTAPAEKSGTLDSTVTLTVELDGEETTMTLEDYLWGVVAAEMPAAFEPEALKAQAIAARTYTMYRIAHPTANHAASLCGDSNCCQAWISREDRLAAWPEEDGEAYAEKIAAAIRETDGEIVTSDGEAILAVFHASSGGVTRSAEEVWGEAISYLTSVESPEDEESVPNYYSVVPVSAEEFQKTFLTKYPAAQLTGDPSEWFGTMNYNEEGLPESLSVGGVSVTTAELRTLFELRSPTLTVEAGEDTVTFYVTGYGHGVGMSQYGANALAKEGKSWKEILAWYYAGAEEKLIGDDK